MNVISFDISPLADHETVAEVIPVVDGARFTDLVHEFERAAGMETREASYGGLIPGWYRFGPLDRLYLGRSSDFTSKPGWAPVLGCSCGEWGCWPFWVRVELTEQSVQWAAFEQPFRPDRDYSDFGPFEFDRRGYEAALETLISRLGTSEGPADR